MKKFGTLALAAMLALSMFTGCDKPAAQSVTVETLESAAATATPLDYSTGVNAAGYYDDSLFYSNDFSVLPHAADPTTFYYDGYYYMYNTSEGMPLSCHRTKNFAEWEYMGTAYDFAQMNRSGKSWARGVFWAPEVFEWQGKFYMYITVNNTHDPACYPEGLEYVGAAAQAGNLTDAQISSQYGISAIQDLLLTLVLVSDKPEGPFAPWTGERTVQAYYHGEKVGKPYVQTVDAMTTVPFFDFANAPEAWETNKFFFDETVDRDAFEAEKGRTYNWNTNIFGTLDAAPFVDEDGSLYMVVVRAPDSNGAVTDRGRGQCIWGCRMFDPVTPDYSSFTQLTQPRRLTVGGEFTYGDNTTEGTMDGGINEGPFLMTHTTLQNGKSVKKYYLAYSTGKKATGNEWGYNIAVAVADSPLGPFEKLPESLGNPLYMVSPEYGNLPTSSWTHGSGHGTFFTAGGETFLLAHSTQVNSTVGVRCQRMPIIDRLVWEYNDTLGYDVPHMNGPSKKTLQPQPFTATGYKNVAPQATVTATNAADAASVRYINDDYRVIHARDDGKTFRTKFGGSTVTLTFDEPKRIRAVMVYNARDIQFAFSKIDYILLENDDGARIIRDLPYPESGLTADGGSMFVAPGGVAVAEFAESTVTKISFKFTQKFDDYKDEIIEGVEDDGSMYGIGISDIVVLGKDGDGNAFEAPDDFDEDAFAGSHMLDLSHTDGEGNRITIDRDLFDVSGGLGNPVNYVYDGNGGVAITGNSISVPFKHDSTADGGFAVSVTSHRYNSTQYNRSWNNGAVMLYTGYGQTNLWFRIFAVRQSSDEVRIVFNHSGSPWSERFYPMEYPDYAGNGAPHTLTVAYLDGVYYISFAAEGGETRAIRIDRNTPYLETAGRNSDTSAMFAAQPKVLGLATIDAGVEFTSVSYQCSDAAAERAIADMQAFVYGNTPQNGTLTVEKGNAFCVGDRVAVVMRARKGYELSELLCNGRAVDLTDVKRTCTVEAGGIRRYVYYLDIREAKTYAFYATFAEVNAQ